MCAAALTAVVSLAAGVLVSTGVLPQPWAKRCAERTPPQLGGVEGGLSAIAAADREHVWVFGDFYPESTDLSADSLPRSRPRIYRWNARAWKRIAPPDGWTRAPLLVDASGPRDLWTVTATEEGAGSDSAGAERYSAAHYDGARWREYDIHRLLAPTSGGGG